MRERPPSAHQRPASSLHRGAVLCVRKEHLRWTRKVRASLVQACRYQLIGTVLSAIRVTLQGCMAFAKTMVVRESRQFAGGSMGDGKLSELGCRTADQSVSVCRIFDLARTVGAVGRLAADGDHVVSGRLQPMYQCAYATRTFGVRVAHCSTICAATNGSRLCLPASIAFCNAYPRAVARRMGRTS